VIQFPRGRFDIDAFTWAFSGGLLAAETKSSEWMTATHASRSQIMDDFVSAASKPAKKMPVERVDIRNGRVEIWDHATTPTRWVLDQLPDLRCPHSEGAGVGRAQFWENRAP